MKKLVISLLFITGIFLTLSYSQTVAIELPEMNVLYVGIKTPVRVAIANYPCNKIVLKPTYGNIIQDTIECKYIYKIDSCFRSSEYISVGVKEGKKINWLDTIEYRVRRAPDPELLIAGRYRGLIRREVFINSAMILNMPGFDWQLNGKITEYSCEIRRNDSIIYKENNVIGNRFSDKLISEIEKSMKGDKYYFMNIRAILEFDQCLREIQSTYYEIE